MEPDGSQSLQLLGQAAARAMRRTRRTVLLMLVIIYTFSSF